MVKNFFNPNWPDLGALGVFGRSMVPREKGNVGKQGAPVLHHSCSTKLEPIVHRGCCSSA